MQVKKDFDYWLARRDYFYYAGHAYMENAWRRCGGVIEKPIITGLPSPEEMWKTQWDDEFEGLMRQRLIQGSFRYGLLNSEDQKKHDPISVARYGIVRLAQFIVSRDIELLVDVANFCLIAFMRAREREGYCFGKVETVKVESPS